MKGMQTTIVAAHPSTRMGENMQAGRITAPAAVAATVAAIWRFIRCWVICVYCRGSAGDQVGSGVQYVSCHSADRADGFPEQPEQGAGDQEADHSSAVVVW